MHASDKKRRAVRSFVRRAGRITQSQQRALDELWPVYGVSYTGRPLEFDELFGTDQPVVAEIGFGNGETLVQLAAANPDQNFLGIEVHEPGVGHCLLKAKEAGIENLRIIAHDAIDVLTHQVRPRSLSRLNLYFPDPWPKKRHHKRRIVQPAFLDLVADRLVDGGTLNIATDWANYAEHIDEVLSQSDRLSVLSAGNMTAVSLSTVLKPNSNGAACARDTAYATGVSGRASEDRKYLRYSPEGL